MMAQNYSTENAMRAPKGWTNNVFSLEKVKNMLANGTGKPEASIKDILEEIQGDQYVFSSEGDFYFWNCASERGAVVLEPKEKDRLWKQMEADIMKIRMRQL
ncbi:hypothetical protein SERLA73DRAFT_186368 [Serpula lacrymans var. lacrymans S7.3]|uniref:Uncharacterized protein n=2 Tax=Serpula lacrymans var. lacrymans TaxID=341189 RepID=F8Q763_SERL3|nr:uncharacterized protein SERLADRAFT_475373 [Serpula lacrymans var. lacrymans S7.9]EGN95401.1 hypothetical protein SERLA73DRAFT_186368 [Serpula lacrymans var. lacrymans S7.3]EGO20937.1 hypothetical protein SERLADRAFT_475373 [Serpula lacrymans var. lacrymans S7.9]